MYGKKPSPLEKLSPVSLSGLRWILKPFLSLLSSHLFSGVSAKTVLNYSIASTNIYIGLLSAYSSNCLIYSAVNCSCCYINYFNFIEVLLVLSYIPINFRIIFNRNQNGYIEFRRINECRSGDHLIVVLI